MRLIVLNILSYICFGFLLGVSTQSSGNAALMDADLVKSIQGEVEALKSNYHDLLLKVQNDSGEIDFLIKQNQASNQSLKKTVDKLEKLITNEESLTQKIQALQKITLQQQRKLNKEKSVSKKLTSNYQYLVFRVHREVDFLKKQNRYLEQKLNIMHCGKMEKLMSEEETLIQNIEALQNITSQQQRELNKAKSKSKKSRVSLRSSLTLLNNSLQELTNSTSIGFKNLNGNVLKEKQLLIVREEMRKFAKKIKEENTKMLGKIDPVCQQPEQKGPCSDYTVKYFFNTTSSKCERFWYGGCQGNQNNFKSDEECKAACVQRGATDLQKIIKDVIDLKTKVTKLESSTIKCLSNLTLMSSKIEKNFKDVEELKADEDAMDLYIKNGLITNILITSELQKITEYAKEETKRVTNLESSTDQLLSNLTYMSSKLEKTFKDMGELKLDAELTCPSEKFTCTKQFQCIPACRKCDGVADCLDKTDEEGCVVAHVQRLNGKLNGALNRQSLENLHMLAYVVTADGRAYTAINRIPRAIGAQMLTLNTIGGIVGWMFAATQTDRAKNGYMLTGGEFNRTAVIKYQSGETVYIRQQFFGHDALDNIALQTTIEGTVPDMINGVKITIDDYKEEYMRVSPGAIKSFSTRTYRMNEVAYKYTLEQTITFKECQHDTSRLISDSMRLGVTRNLVVYDDQNDIVQYAMSNKIGIISGMDPCLEGLKNCHSNSNCIPRGDQYDCVCKKGFIGDGHDCTVDLLECHGGWIKRDEFGASYCFSTKSLSWDDAQDQCGTQNASLADIYSENEAVWLAESSRTHSAIDFWIGGKRENGIYKWFTYDGQTRNMNYTRFTDAIPVSAFMYKCVDLWEHYQYKWYSSMCAFRYNFICKTYF